MLHRQEAEDRKAPEATTWAAEFLLRVGESRGFFGCGSTQVPFMRQKGDELHK
jgi:hypothetical protein